MPQIAVDTVPTKMLLHPMQKNKGEGGCLIGNSGNITRKLGSVVRLCRSVVTFLSKICTAVQGFAVLELFGVRLERQVGSRRAELGSGVGPNVRLGQSLVGAVRSVVPLDAVLTIGEDLLDAGREPSAFRLSIDRLVHLQTKFK